MEAVPFAAAARVWLRIGLQSFGGPAAQIATMHRIVVDELGWVGEARFLHALNLCMVLPGPEAQQLATWLGWRFHGWRGGIVAGGLFVLPGALFVGALGLVYAAFHEVPAVALAMVGVKAAVLGIVAEAVVRIGKRVLKNGAMGAIAVGGFTALLFGVPFPLVVVGAGLVGALGMRFAPERFAVVKGREADADKPGLVDRWLDAHPDAPVSPAQTAATIAAGLALWLGPIAVLAALLGPDDTFTRVGSFFAEAAAVTFGGAYAVLAFVAQRAVESYGWLTHAEMTDALGMAETTPGPLILVNEIVAILAGWRDPHGLPPAVAACLAAGICLWTTFVPSFVWIFAFAPYVEALRSWKLATGALSAITAAVVGVVAHLGVVLALRVLFREASDGSLPVPVWSSFDPAAALIAVVSGVALIRYHAPMWAVLLGAAVAGALARIALG